MVTGGEGERQEAATASSATEKRSARLPGRFVADGSERRVLEDLGITPVRGAGRGEQREVRERSLFPEHRG